MSWEPKRASISVLDIFVNATGVFSPARDARTSKAESSTADTLNAKFTLVFPLTLTT